MGACGFLGVQGLGMGSRVQGLGVCDPLTAHRPANCNNRVHGTCLHEGVQGLVMHEGVHSLVVHEGVQNLVVRAGFSCVTLRWGAHDNAVMHKR